MSSQVTTESSVIEHAVNEQPPTDRTVRSLGVHAPGEAYFFEYVEGPPPPGQARVDTLYTGLSTGTELTFFRGTNPYLSARWDADYGLFREGEPSERLPKPFLGYMEVGRVTESRTDALCTDDIIASTYGHKSGHTLNPEGDIYTKLSGLEPILGIYVGQMGPICANALLHAAHDRYGANIKSLGDGVAGARVLVTGGGVVGLLTGLFARFYGAEVVLVSGSAPRLQAAAALGLTPIDTNSRDAALFVKSHWHSSQGRGADLAFQTSTDPASLDTALRALKPRGTVIDLAFYQGGADALHLGKAFHHNSLSIRCAQIGRVPRGIEHWDRRRLSLATVEVLQTYGDLVREHVITDVVPFGDAPAFLTYLSEQYRPEVIQAVFQVDRKANHAA
ncbi:hypothetical protein BH24DEI2_BH24DEI2_22720 [soil metagenome]